MPPDRDAAHCFVPYPAVAVPHASSGPLAGLTFAVKDLLDVAGYRTGGGNPHVLAMSPVRQASAPTVQRLLDAGAAFVGKTHTDELAFSMSGKNAHYGTPRNGAAPDRIPGGSSSGSASAVSNSLCDFALGTDTGGSVRAPASHCGLYGIRPTHGRISLDKALDLAPSLDTCGFFTRSAEVFARVGQVLLGQDSAILPAAPTLLLAEDAFALLTPEVRAVHAPLLARLEQAYGPARPVKIGEPSFDTLYLAFRHIQGYEAWQADGELIEQHALALGPGVKERFAWSKTITAAQYAEHTAIRERYRQWLGGLLANSIVVLPTMPDIAPLLEAQESELDDYRHRAMQLLCPSGLSGFPQISIPGGMRDGVPLGLSLMGPAGSDRALLAMAEKLAG